MHRLLISSLLLVSLCFAVTLAAQQNQVSSSTSPATASLVPRLIKFTGTLLDEQGRPMKSPVAVSFALYAQQSGGAPLWMETQNVETDEKGSYTVLLGAYSADGVPAELFNTGEVRWLGVQAERQPEQPRVLLVSVPYALKAGDAQTLGGLPPSAFAPANSAPSNSYSSSPAVSPTVLAPSLATGPATIAAVSGSGTTNFIPLWTPNGSTLGNSILFQSTTSNVNVNGSFSLPPTGAATATAGANSQPLDLLASSFNSSISTAVNQHFRWQSEPVGNNTTAPSGKLNLLFGLGNTTPTETGLSINSKGIITFAPGQTFADPGDVKSVGLSAPATDFTVSGSPVTSAGTLKFAWNVVPTSTNTANAIVKRDASGNFSAGAASFSGNLSSAGIVSGAAGAFAGNLAVGGTVSGAAGSFATLSGPGLLLTQLLGNCQGGGCVITGSYLNMITNYVPPVNVRAFTFNRCSWGTTAAGQTLQFRSAIRNPTGGAESVGNAFYLFPSSAATETLFAENNDWFDLTAGQSYDFGMNLFGTPPGGSPTCSTVVQVFSR